MHLIQKVIDLNVMDWVVPKHCNSEKLKFLIKIPWSNSDHYFLIVTGKDELTWRNERKDELTWTSPPNFHLFLSDFESPSFKTREYDIISLGVNFHPNKNHSELQFLIYVIFPLVSPIKAPTNFTNVSWGMKTWKLMGNSARMQNPDLWTKIDLSPTCDKVGCLGILVTTYNQGCLFRPFSAPSSYFRRKVTRTRWFSTPDLLILWLEVANNLWVRVTKTFQKGRKELPGSWCFFFPLSHLRLKCAHWRLHRLLPSWRGFWQNSEEIWIKKPPKPTQKRVKSHEFNGAFGEILPENLWTTPPSNKRTTGTQTKIEHL